MGALRYQKPRLILFHCNCEPTGEYWDAFKAIARKTLRIVQRTPPENIWGKSIKVSLLVHSTAGRLTVIELFISTTKKWRSFLK